MLLRIALTPLGWQCARIGHFGLASLHCQEKFARLCTAVCAVGRGGRGLTHVHISHLRMQACFELTLLHNIVPRMQRWCYRALGCWVQARTAAPIRDAELELSASLYAAM